MAQQSTCDSDRTTLNQKVETEIYLLQSLKDAFFSAKQELNNDLTKIAIKNLPILEDDSRTIEGEQTDHHINETDFSQSTIYRESEQQPSTSDQNTLQQLEPLDLDV